MLALLGESDTKPPPYAKCSARVDRGGSMVRGVHRSGPCEKRAVFTSAEGKHYCATHGTAVGYVPPPKAEKRSWLVFYTDATGRKGYHYAYDMVSERGARASSQRKFPEYTVVGVLPYNGDADFEASPEFSKWKDHWK